MKKCNRCGVMKPLSDFGPNRRLIDGRNGQCRECHNAYHREWRRRNKESARLATQRWRAKNPERNREIAKRYWTSDKGRARAAEWEAANRHRRQQQAVVWEQQNKKKRQEQNRDWYQKNVQRTIHRQKDRQALEHHVKPQLDYRRWQQMIKRAQGRCYYCGQRGRLSMDHVLPLSRGGTHSEGNIVVSCVGCNSSKKNQLLVAWRYTRFRCWFDLTTDAAPELVQASEAANPPDEEASYAQRRHA